MPILNDVGVGERRLFSRNCCGGVGVENHIVEKNFVVYSSQLMQENTTLISEALF